MKMKAWAHAHLYVEAEFEVEDGEDEQRAAQKALNEAAKTEYGIYPSQFEFSDGIGILDAE